MQFLLQLGDYKRALSDYSAALALQPRNAYALYNRGIARDRAGDAPGAVADFTAALAEDPGNADFHHNRGFTLAKLVWLLCEVNHPITSMYPGIFKHSRTLGILLR